MSNLTIVSWCPGGSCDPCKPITTHDLRIVGNYYDTPNPVVYIIAYGNYGNIVTVSGTLTVTSTSSVRPTQTWSIVVSATGESSPTGNALSMPLPDQSTGIIYDANTIGSVMSQTGNVVISGVLAPSLYTA